MTRLPLLSLFFMAVCMSISCKKNSSSTTPPADTPSDIQITSPTAGTIGINGTNLRIEGTITDNNVLTSARVEIRNKNSGAVLFQQSSSTGNVTFYRFLWNWTITGITSTIQATIKVTAKDKYLYEVFKEVDIVLDN